MDILLQIVISTFILGAIYALGAAGLTIIFGISAVLNLAHGGILLLAALTAWVMSTQMGVSIYISALSGVGISILASYLVYFAVIIPVNRSKKISKNELPIFQLVVTLLAALILQALIEWRYGANPIATSQLVEGGRLVAGTFVPYNSVMIGIISWLVLGALWLFISKTKTGKSLLAASMSLKGLALVGYDIRVINFLVWGLYGFLVGVAGVLLASFTGASANSSLNLTVTAFIIVILGGLGSIAGSLLGAYILAFLSTLMAYLVNPAWSEIPGLLLLILVLYVRPQGLFGRY